MATVRVGTCGYSRYDPGEGWQDDDESKLHAYSTAFDVLEFQLPFYELPRVSTTERWRREADDDCALAMKAWQALTHEWSSPTWNNHREGVDTRKLVVAIDDRVDEYAFTTGGGVHAHFPRSTLVRDLNGTFSTGNFAGMSQGFPLAMGAQLALDDRPVFCFEGDGGFAMVMQDLETAVREEIPVKTVVLSNQSYMSQRARQRRFYDGRYTGSTFTNPDFGQVAETFGMPGRSIDADDEIDDAVDWFVDVEGPALLEARIDPWLDTGDYGRD